MTKNRSWAMGLASIIVLTLVWICRGVMVFALARIVVQAVMPDPGDSNPSADYNPLVWVLLAWWFNTAYCWAWGSATPTVLHRLTARSDRPGWWRLLIQGLVLLPVAAAMQLVGKYILRALVGRHVSGATADLANALLWDPYVGWPQWRIPTWHLAVWAAFSLWPGWLRLGARRRSQPRERVRISNP